MRVELMVAKAEYKASLKDKELHDLERNNLIHQIITSNPKFNIVLKLC